VTLLARHGREQRIDAAFADAGSIGDALGDVEVPADVAAWLGRLHALVGVPFGYLVPDEAMLPPESIRFFRLDDNWVRALLDGAFSLGRDLTAQTDSPSTNLDRAVFDSVCAAARAAAPRRRRTGVATAPSDGTGAIAWTGFLLRSRVVTEYPGLGVNVYPQGGTSALLEVHRLDRLGPSADTLFGLVAGDAYRVDVHEAPELLHYGIDDYEAGTPNPTASKELRTFTRAADGSVQFGDEPVDVHIGTAFRTRSPRVLMLGELATQLATANGPGTDDLDSAQMGFAMTEGVGMVSFERGSGT
jgi:hypothetical protein